MEQYYPTAPTNMAIKGKSINSTSKIAQFLIAIGEERASKILKELKPHEVEKISLEISKIKELDNDTKKSVLREMHDIVLAGKAINEGGVDYASQILTKTFGENGAKDIISKLKEELISKPFTITRGITARQLLNIIQNENPQVIAVILSYIEPDKSAEILQELPIEVQLEVSKRIATINKISQPYIQDIEAFLEQRISTIAKSENVEAGGNQGLAQIINKVDRSTERNILEYFEHVNPSIAAGIKEYLFVFDDIAKLDKKSLTKVISKVTNREWAMALKSAYPGIPEAIFSSMSERQSDLIQDEIQMLGPQPIKSVEQAQKHIIETVRKLEEDGDIIISRGDEVLV